MASSSIDVSLRLRNAKRFEQDAKKSGKAVGDIGKGAKKGAKDLDKLERSTKKAHRGFMGLSKGAKLGLGAIGGAAALGAAKNAISTTTGLTKTVMGLQRATKMDSAEAVRWAAQAKVRGIDTKALNMAMGTLSKNMTLAGEGGKSQAKAFERLGISQKEIASTGGDISKLLPMMADHFQKMGPSAKRTASMMALMGRGWQTLTPLMAGGSKEMDAQLKMADKYGVKLGGKPIKSQKQLLAVQRELAMAQLGWQVQFSTEIAPHLIKAFQGILGVSQKLRGVFKWADNHPGFVGAIAGLMLLKKTMNLLPGGNWISRHILSGTAGIGGKLLKRLGGPVKRALMSVLGRGGTAAGERGADALVNSTGSMFGRKSGKLSTTIGGRLKRVGRSAGMAGGKAGGIAFGVGFGIWASNKINNWVNRHLGGDTRGQHKTMDKTLGPGTAPKFGGPTGTDFLGIDLPDLNPFQHGGPIRAGMSALVGEHGPEILQARPTGGFVTPLSAPQVEPLGALASAISGGGDNGGETQIIVPVNLDGREVTRVVAKHTRNLRARR